jgi:hypothetical protein
VHYSVSDKRIFELLEVAKTILTSTLLETRELLVELEGMEFTDRPARRRSAS